MMSTLLKALGDVEEELNGLPLLVCKAFSILPIMSAVSVHMQRQKPYRLKINPRHVYTLSPVQGQGCVGIWKIDMTDLLRILLIYLYYPRSERRQSYRGSFVWSLKHSPSKSVTIPFEGKIADIAYPCKLKVKGE